MGPSKKELVTRVGELEEALEDIRDRLDDVLGEAEEGDDADGDDE